MTKVKNKKIKLNSNKIPYSPFHQFTPMLNWSGVATGISPILDAQENVFFSPTIFFLYLFIFAICEPCGSYIAHIDKTLHTHTFILI